MSFESKSFLARLLAEENLSVQVDSKATTAYFNLKSRTISIPNWDDISSNVYDLLLGHEVGHARDTPFEGFHDSACKNPAMKTFLNVCEDARIEKRMKRRYPGLRASMRKGYEDLMARDLFGVKGKNLSKLLLIDRINLATKLGSLLNVPFFNDVERSFLAEVEGTETWEQVVDVAERLFEYCKEEKKKQKKEEELNSFSDEEEEQEEEQDEQEMDLSAEEEEQDNDSSDADADENEDSDDELESPFSDDSIEEEEEDNGDPRSETDEAFRRNESSLANCGQEVVELRYAEGIAEKIIPANQFLLDIESENLGYPSRLTQMENMYREFLNRNRNLIDVYLREFMMRKSAASWKKARVSDTGDICASRLAQYRMTDQIFKSRTVLPEGKNHGMILLLDCSQSMMDKIQLAVDQTLVLAHFCQKASIPFRVIAFTGQERQKWMAEQHKPGELIARGFNLFEMLNSNLSGANFRKACGFMLGWAKQNSYSGYYNRDLFTMDIPFKYSMGNTPLEEAMVSIMQFLPAWKKQNRLDKVNLIVLNDGDADYTSTYKNSNGTVDYIYHSDGRRYNLRIGNRVYRILNSRDRIQYINQYLREELNVETYGFFMFSSSRKKYQISQVASFAVDKNGISFYDKAKEMLKEQRYFESYRSGYTRYFVILMKEEFEVAVDVGSAKGKALVNKIGKAFAKNTVNKKLNRIVATKFLELAA